jgi:hypothetical protein
MEESEIVRATALSATGGERRCGFDCTNCRPTGWASIVVTTFRTGGSVCGCSVSSALAVGGGGLAGAEGDAVRTGASGFSVVGASLRNPGGGGSGLG